MKKKSRLRKLNPFKNPLKDRRMVRRGRRILERWRISFENPETLASKTLNSLVRKGPFEITPLLSERERERIEATIRENLEVFEDRKKKLKYLRILSEMADERIAPYGTPHTKTPVTGFSHQKVFAEKAANIFKEIAKTADGLYRSGEI